MEFLFSDVRTAVRPGLGFSPEATDVNCAALTTVPALIAGFDLLYEEKFAEARQAFVNWESQVPTEIEALKEQSCVLSSKSFVIYPVPRL